MVCMLAGLSAVTMIPHRIKDLGQVIKSGTCHGKAEIMVVIVCRAVGLVHQPYLPMPFGAV